MRLVTVLTPSGPVAAIETAGGRRAIGAPEGSRALRDVGELLRLGPAWREIAARAAQSGAELPGGLPLLRPVLEPGAVVCVGMNYRKHIAEMGRTPPDVPTWFSKLPRALTDPEAEIAIPAASQPAPRGPGTLPGSQPGHPGPGTLAGSQTDYEGELAVVIGDVSGVGRGPGGGRDIPAERAWEAIAGLTLLDDVSMRDFQRRSPQWFAGKTWERSTPLGPAVVTLDELGGLGDREIVTRVNGEERQRAPLSEMVFDVPALIADLSRIVALRPGDVISTGTPSGVGDAMKPPRHLRPGDVVEVELAGIGVLRNRFVAGE